MKYRKKPVEVEAWQWEGNSLIFADEPDWILDAWQPLPEPWEGES